MKSIILLSFLFLSLQAMAANKVTLFVNLNPAGSFQGVSQKLKGNLVKSGETITSNGNISVSIESFKTGIELRDEHMWKHMNSSKHAKATLTDLKAQNGKATATLEVNGVKKPVQISYKIANNEVLATFTVKASEFNLKKAEYLGVGVDDNIKVEATLPLK